MKKQKIAGIDIGSNSLKLLIVETGESDSFQIVLQERERLRLNQYKRENHLTKEAFNLTANALRRFYEIIESRNVQSIAAVATASVREADNAAEFVREVERQTGVHVKILSSMEEARLIGLAAVRFFKAENKTLLNIDIGGGSTELSLMRNGKPEHLFSMKIGAVASTEKFLRSDPPKAEELSDLQAEITLALESPLQKLKNETWKITSGTSGTILNLAALLDFQTTGDVSKKSEIQFQRLAGLNKLLANLPLEKRAQMPRISRERAEVIVAGGQILESVMRTFNIQTLAPCNYALREGVIINFLRKIQI